MAHPVLSMRETGGVISLLPDVQALLAEADEQFQKGEVDGARALIERAEALSPDSPDIPLIHGNLLFHLGDAQGARRQFARALEKAPRRLDLVFSLATASLAAGDAPAAEDLLVGVLEDPGISGEDLSRWTNECHALVLTLTERGCTRASMALRRRKKRYADPAPKPTLLVYGNCQADVMSNWASRLPEIVQRYRVIYHASFGNPESPSPADLAACVLFWEQVAPWTKFELRDQLPPDVTTVRFPPCDFTSVWPLAVADSLVKPDPPKYPHGRYPVGNRLITELTDKAAGDSDLLSAYRATDILAYTDFGRFHELTVSRMKAREANADVKVADWLLANFRKKRLHWLHYHPTGALLEVVILGLLEKTPGYLLGSASERQKSLALLPELIREEPLGVHRMPIETAVAETLGIEWDYCEPIFGIGLEERLNADDFVRGHIRWRQEELRRRRAES
jgi:hypothetical protein